MIRKTGFTLIELLVVISIISLLSSIILASVSNAREKAQFARVAQELKSMELAFKLWAFSDNRSTWWNAGDFGGQTSPTISTLVANYDLSQFLSSVPKALIGNYVYSNTGQPFDMSCPSAGNLAANGVWIGFGQATNLASSLIFEYLDRVFDGGNEPNPSQCGRVTVSSTEILFHIAVDNDDI